jgi:hypothetical protein
MEARSHSYNNDCKKDIDIAMALVRESGLEIAKLIEFSEASIPKTKTVFYDGSSKSADAD